MCVFVFVSQCAASICIAEQQVPKLPEAAVQPLPWAPFANSDHCLIIISVAITIILTSWPPPGTTLQKCSTNDKTNYQTIFKQTSVMDHLYGTLQRVRYSTTSFANASDHLHSPTFSKKTRPEQHGHDNKSFISSNSPNTQAFTTMIQHWSQLISTAPVSKPDKSKQSEILLVGIKIELSSPK